MEIIECYSSSEMMENGCYEALFPKFRGGFGITFEDLKGYYYKNVDKSFENEKRTIGYMALSNGNCLGMIVITFASWDSSIFDVNIGKIINFGVRAGASPEIGSLLLEKALKKAKEWGIQCLFGRIDLIYGDFINLLETNGFYLKDVSVTLGLSTSKLSGFHDESNQSNRGCIRPATMNDLSDLKQIAGPAFIYSHYHRDPNLDQAKSSGLYECWIENELMGRADEILVLDNNDKVLGFITLHIDPYAQEVFGAKIGFIDLLGMSPEQQGSGFGKRLVSSGLNWLRDRVAFVEIRTQLSNNAALNAYLYNGFNLLSSGVCLPSGVTLHGWL
jgi:GNAT superfamily N-acetyltransferase